MDIKKRIQELSLDQKAKLYFMGLVRQGKIDTLPEDPKAAYVSMMMDKDDYGRSISGKDKRTFMEPEDSMPAARARKIAGMELEDLRLEPEDDDDLRLEPEDDEYEDGTPFYGDDDDLRLEPEDDEYEDDDDLRLEPEDDEYEDGTPFYGDDDDLRLEPELDETRDEKDEEDDEMETRYDYDDPVFENLKEIATELGYLNENKFKKGDIVIPNIGPHKGVKHKIIYDFGDGKYNIQPMGLRPNQIQYRLGATGAREDQLQKADNVNESKVDISYTDPGFKFYKMKVDGKRLDREEGTKYLKGLGIDMEIPRSYNETTLDKIVAKLKEKGIDADHDAAMDVS